MSNSYYPDQNPNQGRKQNQSRFPPSQTKVNPEIVNVGETTTQVKSMFSVNTHLNDQIDQHRDIFSQWTEPQDYGQKKSQSYRKKKQNYQQEPPPKHYKKKQPVYQTYYKSNEKTAEFKYTKEEVIGFYKENQDIGELDQWVSDFPNCFTSATLPPVNTIPLTEDPSEGIIPANSGYSQQQTMQQQQQSRNYRIAAKQKYYQQKQVEKEDENEVPE